MASKYAGHELTGPDTYAVRIAHLDTDSFTRSVDRAAHAAIRGHLPRGRNYAITAARYAPDELQSGRTCVSVFTVETDR